MTREAIEMRYLLGKLSDAEAARLEERSFTDDRVFEEIEFAEDELIDAYVRGSLSSEDRKRFENKLLSSERLAERVEFAKVLSPQLVRDEPAKSHWWDGLFSFSFVRNPAISGAAAAGILLIVVGIPVFQWIRMRSERRLNVERAAIEQQRLQVAQQQLADQQAKTNQINNDLQKSIAEEKRLQEELESKKAELARMNEQPVIASITLISDSQRAPGQRDLLSVPSKASFIRLRFVLESDRFASYRARIESPAKLNVLKTNGLKTRRAGELWIIIWEFPSYKLKEGEYSVTVSGRISSKNYQDVAEYSFRVAKK